MYKRQGFGYVYLSKINEQLVYASTSGFGHTGPYRDRGAVDIIVQGMGGVMSTTGHESDPLPSRVGYSIGDMAAGIYTSIGVLSALVERQASGKGGVGKSSVTTNLAVALAKRGNDVAVIDADVWGFSIPRMLGITEPPSVVDDMLIPPVAHGVRSISMGFFAEEDQPVIWRGPMLHKALNQFLTDVAWDEPDFLLIDLPPGTGDTAISLAGFLPDSEMLVVTTPQIAAQSVAQRAAFMAEKVDIEVRGVIENMSWFTGDDGQRYELFGEGGGSALAEKLGVPLLGQIPLVPTLRAGSDNGNPVAVDTSTEIGSIFAEIARVVEEDLKPTKRRHRELKIN